MRDLKDLLPSNVRKLKQRDDAPNAMNISDFQTRLPIEQLEAVWLGMIALYGTAWSQQYGTSPGELSQDIWGGGLFGFTPLQIQQGMRQCMTEAEQWPPSLPRFRAMCFGIPSEGRTRIELTGPVDERSPFTRFVWSFIDGHRWRNGTLQDNARQFADAYDMAHASVMQGKPMPQAPVAHLTEEKHVVKPVSNERALEYLEKIRKILRLSESEAEAMGDAGVMEAGAGL